MQKRGEQNLNYVQKGVSIKPAVPIVGDRIKVLYDGVLSKNGAAEVTAHIGYGVNLDIEQDVPMVKSDTCFEATIPALKEDYLLLSFKDPADNADDNEGKGYSFDIMA